MIYEFGSETLRCKVSSVGAELISVVHNGKERLWQNDNGGWSGHAPILFPFAGSCAMVVDGVEYPVPKHGFARKSEFACISSTDTESFSLIMGTAPISKRVSMVLITFCLRSA